MKKRLMDLIPETPFEGEPMAVTREPNDMEKSLLLTSSMRHPN